MNRILSYIALMLLVSTGIVSCVAVPPTSSVVSPIATRSEAFQSPFATLSPNPNPFDTPRIMFASTRDGSLRLYSMKLDGSDVQPLDFPAAKGRLFNSLKWVTKLNVFVADISDKQSEDDLYLIDIQGNIVRQLTSNTRINKDDPVYSATANQFAFVCAEQDLDICVVNTDGSGYLNLTNHFAREASPAWSPNGQKIAFVSNRSGVPDVWVVNPDGSDLKDLSHTGEPNSIPLWSPDGTKILFASQRDYNWEVYVMDADGQNPINLTNNPANDFDPQWSPNGAYIAFRSNRDGNDDIYVIKSDGSNVIDLSNTLNSNEASFIWSLDSTKIYYQSEMTGNSEIFVVNRDGTGKQNLTNNPADDVSPEIIGN